MEWPNVVDNEDIWHYMEDKKKVVSSSLPSKISAFSDIVFNLSIHYIYTPLYMQIIIFYSAGFFFIKNHFKVMLASVCFFITLRTERQNTI